MTFNVYKMCKSFESFFFLSYKQMQFYYDIANSTMWYA